MFLSYTINDNPICDPVIATSCLRFLIDDKNNSLFIPIKSSPTATKVISHRSSCVFISVVMNTGFDRHTCSSRSLRANYAASFARQSGLFRMTPPPALRCKVALGTLVGIYFSLQSYCTVRTASTVCLMASVWNSSLPKSQILGIPFHVLPFACLIVHKTQFLKHEKQSSRQAKPNTAST